MILTRPRWRRWSGHCRPSLQFVKICRRYVAICQDHKGCDVRLPRLPRFLQLPNRRDCRDCRKIVLRHILGVILASVSPVVSSNHDEARGRIRKGKRNITSTLNSGILNSGCSISPLFAAIRYCIRFAAIVPLFRFCRYCRYCRY